MRRTSLAFVLTLALAGCGGDAKEDGGRASTDTVTESPTVTDEQRQATSAPAEKGGSAAKEEKPSERSDEKEPNSSKRSDEEEDQRSGEAKAERKDEEDGRSQGPSSGIRIPKGSETLPRRPQLTGRALRRCLARSIRLQGERRLRVQARCLGMSARRLRRLIVANCRRATKSRQAARDCISAAIGG